MMLLTLSQSSPSLPQSFRDHAGAVAQHAIETATSALSSSAPASVPSLTANNNTDDQTSTKPQYLYILSSGQSLSVGAYSSPPISTYQPYNNLSFSPDVQGTDRPLIPLVEHSSAPPDPTMTPVETPSSGIANSLRAWDVLARPIIVGLHGYGGQSYAELKKGTASYQKGMQQLQTAKAAVEAKGGILTPIAVTITRGEADYLNTYLHFVPGTYESYLREWQNDYQTDVNAITGSSPVLPMFITQMNMGTDGGLAVDQLNAHRDNPGKIILVGPKYQFGYFFDHVHLVNKESRYLGELIAKVIKRVVFDKQHWDPLMPTSIQRSGNIITVSYAIPAGQLAIDTHWVAPRPNDGFDFVQTGGTKSISITDVRLINNNTQVQITLSDVPDVNDCATRGAATRICPQGGMAAETAETACLSAAIFAILTTVSLSRPIRRNCPSTIGASRLMIRSRTIPHVLPTRCQHVRITTHPVVWALMQTVARFSKYASQCIRIPAYRKQVMMSSPFTPTNPITQKHSRTARRQSI